MEFSEEKIERLLRRIYSGKVTNQNLPEDLYFAIADYLKKGLYFGFGSSLSDVAEDSVDFALIQELRDNVYMFSAAKTYSQVTEMEAVAKGISELLVDGQEIRSFREFRDVVLPIYEKYNVTWLETEYNTAIGQAQNAARWQQVEARKNELPFLRYSAVMDANTSDICRPLDGVTLPVDDPFWKRFMPMNHFNCRCTVEQIDEGRVTPPDEADRLKEETGAKMQDVFKMNPGKDRVIFDSKHPYFDVAPKDKAYAMRNFDLPIPENDN